MGAWGVDSFENDDASDWLADFCEAPDKTLIPDALSKVADMDSADYLEAPECCVGLAAAEVVAFLKGAPNTNLPSEAKDCLANLDIKADPNLVALALRAVERIKTNSELKELFDESESTAEWTQSVGNLETRLKQ